MDLELDLLNRKTIDRIEWPADEPVCTKNCIHDSLIVICTDGSRFEVGNDFGGHMFLEVEDGP